MHQGRKRRRPMRRAVIMLPSGLTIANLFFGVFAIVSASRGELSRAGLWVVIGGVLDAFDGRVARATNTGSKLGSELDSLVDVISFGLAPAMIMYYAVLNRNGWDWVFVFAFVACAALRLARFNVEQAGRAKRYFHGLPSPAAGLTLATYYWFSQTTLYNDTNISDLPWHVMLRFVMGALAALMVSDVSYPAVPTVGLRSLKEILGTLLVVATIVGVFFVPKQFFFPACLAYVVYGLGSTVLLGLLGRRAGGDSPVITHGDEDEEYGERDDQDDEEEQPELPAVLPAREARPHGLGGVHGDSALPSGVARRRKRRRRPRGDRPPDHGGSDDQPPPSP
ncbi:MAG: CDP-diacylglycerol--serine O-phosphatidyltransferase [Gemmatimonadaceae bacterium]